MNYATLRGQYLLLDTNVVINLGRYTKFYQPFVDQLIQNDIALVISKVVETELLAYTSNESEKAVVLKLLKNITSNNQSNYTIPFVSERFEQAAQLAQRYQNAKVPLKRTQLPDLLIGAEMVAYEKSGHLFLATENHEDFPRPVFERLGIETIDCPDNIHNVGIYKLGGQ